MDIIDLLARQEDYFKQGIYWCIPDSDNNLGTRLSEFLERDEVYLTRIPGFDEFMAEIHHKAGLTLPEPVVNPLWMARSRARLYTDISPTVKNNRLISQDIIEVLHSVSILMDTVNRVGNGSEQSIQHYNIAEFIPPLLRAEVIKHQQKIAEALDEYKLALADDPDDGNIAVNIANALYRLGRFPEIIELAYSNDYSNRAYMLLLAGDNQGVINETNEILKREPENAIDRINRAIAYKR